MMIRDDLETREVILPVSGQVAVIREGDGYSDRKLLKRNKDVLEQVPEYLASLTVSIGDCSQVTTKTILDLLVPDQEFLAVECFRLNYGDDFKYKHVCSECSNIETQVVRMSELELRPIPPESTGSPDPIVRVTLPRSGKTAEVGMLDGDKERILLEQAQAGVVDPSQRDYLALRSLDGAKDFSYEDVARLKAADHLALREAQSLLVCGYDTFVFATCSECGFKRLFNLLSRRDFFLPGG